MAGMAPSKRILIIAGPNGAGKTTFATEFLLNEADCPTFVNADLIASGVNPFQPERSAVRAGRLMLDIIEEYVLDGESFAFEITLSGRGFARRIPRWRKQGYWVKLYFLRLPSADMAVAPSAVGSVRAVTTCLRMPSAADSTLGGATSI